MSKSATAAALSAEETIRAWKDEEYADTLEAPPENPAGVIDISHIFRVRWKKGEEPHAYSAECYSTSCYSTSCYSTACYSTACYSTSCYSTECYTTQC